MGLHLKKAQQWMGEHLRGEVAALPFSFTFGGKTSAELLNSWPLEQSTSKLDEQRTRHTLKYTDPKSKVEVRCESIEQCSEARRHGRTTARMIGSLSGGLGPQHALAQV